MSEQLGHNGHSATLRERVVASMDGVRDRMPTPSGGTVDSLARRVGKVVLWLALIVLLWAGVRQLFGGDAQPVSTATVAQTWPSREAEAFAERFTRALLSHDAERMGGMLGPDVTASDALQVPDGAKAPAVEDTSVARSRAVNGRDADVTVATTVRTGDVRSTRFLRVRVGRDAEGGLQVDGYPSFVAAPSKASLPATDLETLDGNGSGDIEKLSRAFLDAYLAGQGDVTYLTTPRSNIRRPDVRFSQLEVDAVYAAGPQTGVRRRVTVDVRAVDSASKATYQLRYELTVERHERWLVAKVEG